MTYAFAEDAPFWDGIAESYARKPVDDPEAFERKIAITRGLMTPGCTLLDVGCGTGSLALILATDAGEVHGLDLSPGMIDIARGKAGDQGVDNAHFHVGDLGRFDAFEPGELDVVCAYSLLHLVPDRTATLGRMLELLRPGGAFVASTVCLTPFPYGLMLPVMRWLGKAPHVKIVSHDAMVREIEAAGFVDVQRRDVGAKSKQVCFVTARKP